MAIYGLQAWERNSNEHSDHSDFTNLTEDFINNSKACVDYFPGEAGSYYQIFQSIKVGDIIYLKEPDWQERKLKIRAIGIVTDNQMIQGEVNTLKYNCLENVKWYQLDVPIIVDINHTAGDREYGDPYASRIFGITLYEEYTPFIQKVILEEIFNLMG